LLHNTIFHWVLTQSSPQEGQTQKVLGQWPSQKS
jgi:hypothetical protein